MIRGSLFKYAAVAAITLMTLAVGAAVAFATPGPADQPAGDSNWFESTGNVGNTRYSSLAQINTQNIKNLGAAWVSDKFDDGASSRATPVVHNGVMFITAGTKIYALDAKTGETVWKVGPFKGTPASNGRAALITPGRQGVVVADGKIFVGFTGPEMYALDEKTGETVWHVHVGNFSPTLGGNLSAAPVYSNGVIYLAVAFADGRYSGQAIAIDAHDGRQLWDWHSIPSPGEPGHETWAQNNDIWKMGGGDIWLPPAVDPDLGLVYYGTGNAAPPKAGANLRPGNNLYTCTVVALDIKTGKLRWHYQLVHHDLWESDVGNPVVLYDAQVDGKPRKALAALRVDGVLFLLDRATGKPIWPVKEKPVRQSVHDDTSPTQPFPVDRASLIERDCSNWKPIAGFVMRCEFFEPLTDQGPNILAFGPSTRSSPLSYSPQTGYFYIQGTDRMDWFWNTLDPSTFELNYFFLTERVPNLYKRSVLVFEAVDPATYKVVWRKEMRGAPNRYGVGGWLTTGGGLAFHRVEDGNLVAFDAKSGDELWKFQTGEAATDIASPMSYEVDGEQYVAVSQVSQVWAFHVGGNIPPRPAPKLAAWDDVFQVPNQNTQTIMISVPNPWDYRHEISPLKARVKVGSDVTFNNSGVETHTFVADDGSWTTGPLLPRQTAVVTFDKPGSYLYHCKEHPWAYGFITVVGDASASSTAGSSNAAANQ